MSASADVTSANTVGFQTKTVAADTWYMLAPQFNGVAANSDEEIDLLKVLSVSGITPQAYAVATAASICTQIQVYENGLYTPYYYINNGRRTGDPQTGSLVGWGKNRNLANEIKIKPYQGFWVKVVSVGDNPQITFAGEVRNAATTVVPITGSADGNWTICNNPYPVAAKFSDIVVADIVPQAYAVATAANLCTQIQVYDGGIYTPYYYINNGRQTGVEGTGSLIGWGKNRNLYLDTFVQPGQSFWVKAYSSGSLTFKFPGADK